MNFSLKKIGTLIFLIVAIFISSGCNLLTSEATVTSIEVDATALEESYDIETFELSSISIKVSFSDGKFQLIPITEAMLSSEHQALLSCEGEHEITVTYENKTTAITLTLFYSGVKAQLIPIYHLAKTQGGYEGSFEEWITSIKGDNGLSIIDASLNMEGHLILTLSDDSIVDSGKVLPAGVDCYLVIFKDGETVLKEEIVPDGNSATPPIIPTKEGHTFQSWDKEFNEVKNNLEVNILWEKNTYEISFYSQDVLVQMYNAEDGEIINLPKDPFKLPTTTHYYQFSRWIGYKNQMIASSNLSFVAEFTEHPFTVVEDTKLIARQRHLAAIDYIDRYLIQNFPEEALKIHHGTRDDVVMLTTFVQSLVAEVLTDQQKVQIIYQWIKDTIEYDNCSSAYAMDVFKSLKGDCLGQALLMVDMLKLAGMPASIASGDRGSMGEIITEQTMNQFVDHAWVLVYVDNSWELLDPLFETYMPDIEYIQTWYYTAMVDWTIPYYPNINLSAVNGVCELGGYYFPVIDGVVQTNDGGYVLLVDDYQVSWCFNDGSNNFIHEDKNWSSPIGAAFTGGWLYWNPEIWNHSSIQKYTQFRPNGQKTSATIYQQEEEIIYFSPSGDYMNIEGVKYEDIEIFNGLFTVEMGAIFKFVRLLDKVDHNYNVIYQISDETMATIDDKGYITALSSGEVLVTYEARSALDTVSEAGGFNFIIK
jgi:hypothetical protein